MYFYLIISHLNYSFIFVFDPPPIHPSPAMAKFGKSLPGGGGSHTTLIIQANTVGGVGVFYFPLSAPRTKFLLRFQTAIIIAVIFTMVIVVVFAAIVDLVTLYSLTLDLFPQQIAIYPSIPALHGLDFDLNLDTIPGLNLNRPHCLGHPRSLPLFGYSNDLVFMPRASSA